MLKFDTESTSANGPYKNNPAKTCMEKWENETDKCMKIITKPTEDNIDKYKNSLK